MSPFLRTSSKERSFLLLLGVLLGVFLLPLLLVDAKTSDDLLRAVASHGWMSQGRPLANILFYFIQGKISIADIFPLPLLISLGFLLAAGWILYRQFLQKYSLISAVGVSFLTLANPFALSYWVFQYDCLNMSFALLMSITSSWLYQRRQIFGSALCLLATFLSYQYFVFLTFCFILFQVRQKMDKETFSLKRALLLLGGWALLSLFVLVVAKGIYALLPIYDRGHRYMKVALNSALWVQIGHLLQLFAKDLSIKIFFLLPFFYAVILECWVSWNFLRRKKFLASVSIGGYLLGLGVLFLLPMLFTDNTPHIRYFAPVLFFFFLAFLTLAKMEVRLPKIQILWFFPIFYVLSYAYAFGHFLQNEKDDQSTVLKQLITDISAVTPAPIRKIYSQGALPLSLKNQRLLEEYPFFDSLQEITIADSWAILQTFQQNIFFRNLSEARTFSSMSERLDDGHSIESIPVSRKNALYELRVWKNTAIIRYKTTPPF